MTDHLLSGTVERVVYRNDENGWAVVAVELPAVNGQPRERVTATGALTHLNPGEAVTLQGNWESTPKYGDRFAVRDGGAEVTRPQDRLGVERWLCSIPGVGPATAAAIAGHFGDEDLFDIAVKFPERLAEVPGVGVTRALGFAKSIAERASSGRAAAGLRAIGIPERFVPRVLRRYGGAAIDLIRENPYRLIDDFEGVGFVTADTVGRAAGVPHTSPFRVQAGVMHVLAEAAGEGHCCVLRDRMVWEAAKLLGLTAGVIDEQCAELEQTGRVVFDGTWCYTRFLFDAEVEVAKALRGMAALSATEARGVIDCPDDAALDAMVGLALSPLQREAIRAACTAPLLVITGGPGRGKSLLCRLIVMLAKAAGAKLAMCAPTGRAAKRLSELTGGEARTVHRTLAYHPDLSPQWRHNKLCQLDADVVLMDECFDYKQPILTEHGWEYIGRLVNAKMQTRVWSRNPTSGELELRPVIRWIKKPAPGSLLKIVATRTNSRRDARVVRCTPEHRILTPSGYVRAGELVPGDEVIARGRSLTPYQFSLLVGAMLGDGSMGRNLSRNSPQPCIMHGEAQKDWLEYKHRAFGDIAGPLRCSASGYANGAPVWRFTVGVTDDARRVAEQMPYTGAHPSGRRQWSPTDRFLEWIDPIALMVWFLDNGTLSIVQKVIGESYCATLHTQRFDASTHEKFAQVFMRKWGINAIVARDSHGFLYLRFRRTETEKLLAVIRPHAPSFMDWKVPGACAREHSQRARTTTVARVASIERVSPSPHQPNVYDIEVAEFHNYVAGNIIVSNCSMTDLPLMYRLTQALPHGCRLILVGDADQLPSVGAGRVLRDVIESGVCRVIELDQIFRQGAGSLIAVNADHLNKGEGLELPARDQESDFRAAWLEDPETLAREVVRMAAVAIPKRMGYDFMRDVWVLSPMKKTAVGVEALNRALQDAVNPHGASFGGAKAGLRVGDRVMQTINDYQRDIYNGDTGFVEEICDEGKTVKVRIDDRIIEFTREAARSLRLAYACTVHKFQGNQAQCILLIVHPSHWIMLTRSLIYTGMTRAQRLLVICGTKRAVEIASSRAESRQRWTGLRRRLSKEAVEVVVPNETLDGEADGA